MNDDTRLDCSDIPCPKHQKYYAQSCPECEIDWLKKELEAVKAENKILKANCVLSEEELRELLKGGE